VIQDEARHVHYGVVALREHVKDELTDSERREREDWCFEVALLMRNRLMAWEVYEEHFEHRLTRSQWAEVLSSSRGFEEFRHVMFSRLMPNLREIGLLSERIKPHYERVGLARYFQGRAASEITADEMLAELDTEPAAA
jgi:hypothetical protein